MKIYLQLFLLILISIYLPTKTTAQKCKTNIVRQQHIQQSPNIRQQVKELNQYTENWIRNNKNQKSRSRQVVTLDVVVHVLWYEPEENISEEQILSQIAVLNKDFRKQNDDFRDQTPLPFQSIAADIEMEFRLATIDPFGNPTNGITRTQTNVEEIGTTENWYSASTGGVDAWDNKRYINIWVCNIGTEFLGFASPPGTADEDDGLVIGHQYFGTTGTAATNMPNHLGRTGTHEMGHYFNLEHLWGIDGGCDDDDLVSDTPNQDQSSFGCPSYPHYDFCTTTGDGINFNNFMDYSDDECLTMFTQGQKMRMLAALNGPRASLLSEGPCLPAGASCDDKNENTINDKEDGNCNCIGELCPPAGTACNDGLASTKEDVYDTNCNCIGTLCPAIGTPCNDGLSITENDQEDGNCNCRGTLCPAPGVACDDGNPTTQNDVEDGNCNCEGTSITETEMEVEPATETESEMESEPATETESEVSDLLSSYPALANLFNNCAEESVSIYKQGIYIYFFITSPTGSVLYNEQGQLYCTNAENYDCLEAFNLTELVSTHSCQMEVVIPPISSSNNTEIFNTYSWLNNILDPNNCTANILVYRSSGFEYLLIENDDETVLYNADGVVYCTNSTNFNCLDFYQIDEEITRFSCIDNESDLEIFSSYPWLSTIINPASCGNTKVTVYQQGTFKYLLIETTNGAQLYNESGNLYCTNQPNYSCTALYNLEIIEDTWVCQNGSIQSVPSNSLIPTSARKRITSYQVYPNPNNGQFYINFSALEDVPEMITIMDVQGKIIQTLSIELTKNSSTLAITINAPESGVYFLQFYSTSGVQNQRIIVE